VVASGEGDGSTFRISLPIRQAQQAAEEEPVEEVAL
jgi:hypothetical protein